jgi:hypothetical protein
MHHTLHNWRWSSQDLLTSKVVQKTGSTTVVLNVIDTKLEDELTAKKAKSAKTGFDD